MAGGGRGRVYTTPIPTHGRPSHQEARPNEQSEHISARDDATESPRWHAETARQDPDETPTPTGRHERASDNHLHAQTTTHNQIKDAQRARDHAFSDGRNEDSVKVLGFWHFFVSRNPRNLRPEPSSLVSTSFTHSGDDEDSGDSGIISLFGLLEYPESSHRIQLQNVCVLH